MTKRVTAIKPTITDVKVLFERPQGEKLLVGKIIDIDGKRYLDIRSHYINDDGEKVPTSRGIRLGLNDVRELYLQDILGTDFSVDVMELLSLKGGVASERS